MSAAQLHLISPERVADFVRTGRLRDAMREVAALVGAELTIGEPTAGGPPPGNGPDRFREIPITYRSREAGRLLYGGSGAAAVERAAAALRLILEHALEREEAVGDLAEAMITCFEELNMLYTLVPRIVTTADATEIGEVLVHETSRTLHCRRVSLLLLDESGEAFRVLASCGLPAEVCRTTIPVAGTIAGRALRDEDLLVVNDAAARPDLARMSRGCYESAAYAVVRVPLCAREEPLGILTATERCDGGEFTARDRKLIEGLSALGASALLNCRLHAALDRQMMSTIRALASAVDAKDHYTHAHSARVAHLCVATARKLGVTDAATCREIELAGLLHDTGKIGIPDAILAKQGRLTPEEFAVIKTHADIGAGIVQHVPGLAGVAKAIRHHHERYDGLGYPGWLGGGSIPLASRLIAVADTYDSLTSDRPYRKAVDSQRALRELQRNRETQFDPAVVDAFASVVSRETAPPQSRDRP